MAPTQARPLFVAVTRLATRGPRLRGPVGPRRAGLWSRSSSKPATSRGTGERREPRARAPGEAGDHPLANLPTVGRRPGSSALARVTPGVLTTAVLTAVPSCSLPAVRSLGGKRRRGHAFLRFCTFASASSAVARNAYGRLGYGSEILSCRGTNSPLALSRRWSQPEASMV